MAAKFKAYVPQGTPVLDGATPVYLKREFSGISDAVKSMQKSLSGGFLSPANNLSDVANAATARTNLGLGAAATQPLSAFLQPSNNLSDVANAGTARTNLGLGAAATQPLSAFLQPSNNLSDVGSKATALANLGLSSAEIHGDVNVTLTATAVPIVQLNASLTANRTWTLPVSFSLPLASSITFCDDGGIGAHTLTFAVQAGDAMLGVGVSANAITLTVTFQSITFLSTPAGWVVVAKT